MTYPLNGRIWNYCNIINISNASYNTTYDIIVPFVTQSIMLLNKGTTTVIDVSTNGQNSGWLVRLDANDSSKSISMDNICINQLWFKLVSGSAADIMVVAWATR